MSSGCWEALIESGESKQFYGVFLSFEPIYYKFEFHRQNKIFVPSKFQLSSLLCTNSYHNRLFSFTSLATKSFCIRFLFPPTLKPR